VSRDGYDQTTVQVIYLQNNRSRFINFVRNGMEAENSYLVWDGVDDGPLEQLLDHSIK
jgi:hypothetical protein